MVRQGTWFLADEHLRPGSYHVFGSFYNQVLAHKGVVDADRVPTHCPEARAVERRRETPAGINEFADAITALAPGVVRGGIKIANHDEGSIFHNLCRFKDPVPAGPLDLQGLAVIRYPNSENLETFCISFMRIVPPWFHTASRKRSEFRPKTLTAPSRPSDALFKTIAAIHIRRVSYAEETHRRPAMPSKS